MDAMKMNDVLSLLDKARKILELDRQEVNTFAGRNLAIAVQSIKYAERCVGQCDPLMSVLDERARNCLKRGGYATIDDVCEASASDLLAMTNFGTKSLNLVRECLFVLGRHLKNEGNL